MNRREFLTKTKYLSLISLGSALQACGGSSSSSSSEDTSTTDAGVTINNTSLSTSESLTTASFTVVLDSQPSDNVVIALTNNDATEGSLSSSTLTFTSSNWSTEQTITITGVDDSDIDGDISYTVNLEATSNDSDYDGISIDDVTITNTDNDVLATPAGVTINNTSLSTSESLTTDSFTVVLDSQPSDNVVIALTNNDATEGSLSSSTLTFTSSNWSTEQTITITGVDDSDIDGDISYTVNLEATSNDSDYDGISIDDVTITNTDNDNSTTTLSIPPLVEPDGSNTISLRADEGTTEFYDGVSSSTKGFIDVNNDAGTAYLGPTIRMKSINSNISSTGAAMVDLGSQSISGADQTDFNAVNFTIFNNTSTSISTHWHGLHVDGTVDGGPYNAISAGATWSPTLNIYQPASTYWYHTHIHGNTEEEVYKGLAGLLILDDDNSEALETAGLPSTYGVDDIPLIIQDKDFVSSTLDLNGLDSMSGRFFGDTMLVNGTVSPNLEVERGLIRFRLLNASNARFYEFTFTDNANTPYDFEVIATDGGFLGSSATVSSLKLSPGERYEIVVDFQNFSVGDTVTLKSTLDSKDGTDSSDSESGLDSIFDVMTFLVTTQTSQTASNTIPTTLNDKLDSDRTTLLAKTPDAYAYVHLTGGANPMGTFRDTSAQTTGPGNFDFATYAAFDMNTINITSTSTQTTAGYTEQWFLRGIAHPFHLHGCSALIKTIGGAEPPDELKGWKDVFELQAAEDVVFYVQFNEKAESAAVSGDSNDYLYMMHCHILGHEDDGMMGALQVI